ncbi:MAG: hypothetical protein FWD26_08780 [Treponema sp.]|nr:hypothetical protein [Treponema sp.]
MKTIPLNIMTSYPVKWTKHQVLRDIIQNFYDSIGAQKFNNNFIINYKPNEEKIYLSIANEGFSYKWLLHMGASTKQNISGKYAGSFGEGFKMASLCALRDYNWKIKMSSRSWSLDVCTLDTSIDGKLLQQLAYNVTEGSEHSNITLMTIEHFTKEDANLFNDVVLGFYFPENTLFGKSIFESEYAAVYERSNKQKPECLPSSIKVSGEGIIFIGYQIRGGFNIPLVICNHRYKLKDRDRNNIYHGTILDVLIDLIDYIDAKTSCYLLEKMKKYWYDYPENNRDVDSWYSLIKKLICKVTYFDSAIKNDFIKRHHDLVVCERPLNQHMRNQKTQALAWKKLYLPNAYLVQDNFYLLGYDSIINLCEKAGGFNMTRKPNIQEKNLLKIMENATKEIFSDFFIYYPDYMIIENDTSVYNGTAHILKNKNKLYNSYGYLFSYKIEQISIKKSSLVKDNFSKAFSTYCHELCHCFGTDASSSFSKALTDIIAIITKNTENLQKYNRLWLEHF